MLHLHHSLYYVFSRTPIRHIFQTVDFYPCLLNTYTLLHTLSHTHSLTPFYVYEILS